MKILSLILSTTMLINSIPCIPAYAGHQPEFEGIGETNQPFKHSLPSAPYTGTDDFKVLTQKGEFVDKTLFIKEVISSPYEAVLITRPRRWGKTINMSMLKYFFTPEMNEEGRRVFEDDRENLGLFEPLKINSGNYLDTREIVNRLLLAQDVEGKNFRDNRERILEIAERIDFEDKKSVLENYKAKTLEDKAPLKAVIKNYGETLITKLSEVEGLSASLEELNQLYEKTHSHLAEKEKKKVQATYNNKFDELQQRIEASIKSDSALKSELSKEFDLMSRHQGQYPTILLSLKAVKKNTFEGMKEAIESEIVSLFAQYKYLKPIAKLWHDAAEDPIEFGKKIRENIIENKDIGLEKSLKTLSDWLYQHHGKKTYILIDEYDTPLNQAYLKNYTADALELMRDIFGSAFKGNFALEKGILTGILRVAKADLFSGLNNFVEDSVLKTQYSKYYGFTEGEVSTLLDDFKVEKKQDVKQWYNGYRIGNETLYNPWSVV